MGQFDKLVTNDHHHTDRPPKLTAAETIDLTTLPAAVPEICLVPTKMQMVHVT